MCVERGVCVGRDVDMSSGRDVYVERRNVRVGVGVGRDMDVRVFWERYLPVCYIIVSLYLANRDFDPSNVIVSFQPMDDTACAEIAIADDSVSESREVFSVSISVPETDVAVTIGQPERAVVIINDLISELSTMVQFGVGSLRFNWVGF